MHLPSATYAIANILKPLETSSSIGMFARDTGGCLIARLGLSRTKEEAKEVAFSETTESAIFYFSAPALAKGTSKLFSKMYGLNKDEFNTSIKDIKNVSSETLKKIKLAKFNQIATTFAIILPFVFSIAPVRNLLTLMDTGKNKFSNIIGLDKKEKDNNIKKSYKKEKARNKAKKLIKNMAKISALALFATGTVSTLAKNDKIYKKIEPFLDKFIKNLEFTKNGDLELAHYAALIYPVSILGYFSACRDKYEVMENIRRFSITVPLLFCGEKLIQNPIYKGFDKLFKTQVMNSNGNIKSYSEILKMPQETQKQFLKTKNFAYGLTFLINTILIAGAVALLNKIQTKKSYKKDNTKNNTLSQIKPVKIKEYINWIKTNQK